MSLPLDVCRCVAQKCKVKDKCLRSLALQDPPKDRMIPHADFSFAGLPCPHFLTKEHK